MNTPPFLMLAALTFWGWRTGLLVHGVIAGVVLEVSRHVPLRWDFTEKELKRFWDLCVLLLIGALAYTYFSDEAGNPTFLTIQWLPLLFLPIMLAQAFGHLEQIPASTFFLIRIHRPRALHEGVAPAVNISHAYFGVCLLAAGAVANNNRLQEYVEYFGGICVLTIWALWRYRALRFSPATWVGLFAVALGLTYAGAMGLIRVQSVLEGRISELISTLLRQDVDPVESRTSLGEIGTLKLSGRIVLRVEVSKGTAPELLRKASYDNFQSTILKTSWHSTHRDFTELDLGAEDGYWKLIPNKTSRQEVILAGYLTRGAGTLALPMGTAEIDNLPVGVLKTNLLGTVQAAQGPGLVRYLARFGSGLSLDGAVTINDTVIPSSETNALAAIAADLKLVGRPASEAARRLTDYFQREFSYTTDLTQLRPGRNERLTPVSRFLLRTRSGHCEYFATATVLLLRQVGIPARYIIGYSVQEAAGPHRYLVRERHAHAWVVYFDEKDGPAGAWHELDTTPSGWGPLEDASASRWEPFRDFFSRLWFQFSSWRWLTDRSTMQSYIFGLLILLVAILSYRLLTAKRRGRAMALRGSTAETRRWAGDDSDFYLIEGKLTELGLAREPWETFTDWFGRLNQSAASRPCSTETLRTILNLHYRYRFDPAGLPEPDRHRLRDLVQSWLAETRAAAVLPRAARS